MNHLCLFTDSLELSGVGKHMLTLAAELRTQYRISLLCPPTPGGSHLLRQAQETGIEPYPLHPATVQVGPQPLADWLRDQRVTVFHGHAGIGWEGHSGIWAARAAGVPVVVRTEHLPDLITDPQQRRDTVAYLTRKMAAYDVVVACQAVPDVYPALAQMARRPLLIEHGGLVAEALEGPKHFTTRYVGVRASIRDAAAARCRSGPTMLWKSLRSMRSSQMASSAMGSPQKRIHPLQRLSAADGPPPRRPGECAHGGRKDSSERLESVLQWLRAQWKSRARNGVPLSLTVF